MALSERASRFVLPEGEVGAALVRRVVTERCEVVLGGLADPVEDPAAFVVGAGEFVRVGEGRSPTGDLISGIASDVEALGGVAVGRAMSRSFAADAVLRPREDARRT